MNKPIIGQSGHVTSGHLVDWAGGKIIGDAEATSADISHGFRVSYAISVDFNSSNTDTPIRLPFPQGITGYRVHGIRISGASHAINAATCGVFTEPSATGIAVVASGTPVTVTQTGPDINNNMQSLVIANQDITAFGDTTLYFRVQTPEGVAAKANVSVVYELLDITSAVSPQNPPPPPFPVFGPISSAGVFDATGALVRTLWSAQLNDPRVTNPAAAWNGLLDDGSVAPAGIYNVALISNNVTYSWEGVIGNSSPDHTNVSINQTNGVYTGYHSYGGSINDLAITPAGEMYFVTSYDERMNTMHVTTTANPQYANGIIGQGFRNTFTDELNVCTDGILAYFHFWDGLSDQLFNGMWAVNCTTKAVITFPSGSGNFGGLGNFVGADSTGRFIFGVAVQLSGNYIFISRVQTRGALSDIFSIWTCDKTSGATVVTNLLGFANQGRCCTNPATGDLWVAHNIITATASATFDPPTSSSGWTFSNGNLTVANGPNPSIYAYSNGNGTKIYFEVVQNANPNGVAFANPVGVASSLGGRNNQGFLGNDANSVGFYGDGSYFISTVHGATTPTWGVGDNVSIACDTGALLIWVRVNGGNWNNSPTANPATGTGGLSISGIGAASVPVVAAVATDTVGPNSQLTAHFASASWTYSAPAGFSQLPGFTRSPAVSKCTVNAITGVLTDTGIAATTGLVSPGALVISSDGSRLLVVDAGTSQQIKAFKTSDGSVDTLWNATGVMGDAGGYANGPAVSNTRYMFASNLGFAGSNGWIAYAPDGSFWFGDAGNSRYLHFSSGNSPTYIEQIAYFPGYYSCWVCRNDDTRVFGGYLEFKIDYSKPLQVGNGSWTLVNNWGANVPGGVQGNGFSDMRWTITGTNGRTYVAIGVGGGQQIFEMTSTGYRAASVIGLSFDYIDAGFNLWAVNGGTTGTQAQYAVNRFTGFDGSNNPTWQNNPTVRPSNVVTTSVTLPGLFPEVKAGENNSSKVVEALANGVIPVYNVHSFPDASFFFTQHHFGGINSTTGQLVFSTHPPPQLNFNGNSTFLFYPPPPVFPGPGNGNPGDGSGVTDNGGGFITFVPGTTDAFTVYRGENWGSQQTLFWSHWDQSGLLIGRAGCAAPYFGQAGPSNTLLTPPTFPLSVGNLDALTAAPNGLLPMNATYGYMGTPGLAGNVFNGGIAFQNGNYYLYNNDEWYHGGIHRWKISNLNTIIRSNKQVTWSGSFVPPPANPYNFLLGLPYNTANLPNGTGGWTRNPTTDNVASNTPDTPPWNRVLTNFTICDIGVPPDIYAEWNFNPTTNGTLSYSWTRIGTGNWSLTGTIAQFGMGDNNVGTTRHMYIDILDNTGKKLLRMENINQAGQGPGIDGAAFWINGSTIRPPLTTSRGASVWGNWIGQQQPLVITVNVLAGTMTVSYAGFTKTGVTVNDVGANIAMPAQFLVTYNAQDEHGRMGLDISAMLFADL